MEKWIDKIFSLKTLPGKLVFICWFGSMVLIILPEKSLKWLSLFEFKHSLSLYIGPVGLLTSAILIWMIIRYVYFFFASKNYIKIRIIDFRTAN